MRRRERASRDTRIEDGVNTTSMARHQGMSLMTDIASHKRVVPYAEPLPVIQGVTSTLTILATIIT